MTAKVLILETLKREGVFLAVHEFNIKGYSENCLASRCPEMAKDGVLVGRFRVGENFKEWGLPEWMVKESPQDRPNLIKNPCFSPSNPMGDTELPFGLFEDAFGEYGGCQ